MHASLRSWHLFCCPGGLARASLPPCEEAEQTSHWPVINIRALESPLVCLSLHAGLGGFRGYRPLWAACAWLNEHF